MVKKQWKQRMIKSVAMASILTIVLPNMIMASRFTQSMTSRDPDTSTTTKENKDRIIVLDPGHGKSSSAMTDTEKTAEGFLNNGSGWGEWRHWKDGTYGENCTGSGCTGSGSSCWYSIGSGDRDTEPTLNLNNAMAAKRYLEEMGYTVRMTRTSNEENPSFTKRASYCFNNNDTSQAPDAELYVCIHSNAYNGSTRGTSYIAAAGTYTQKYIPSDYVAKSNQAGDVINKKVAEASGLQENSPLTGQGYLIAFNKNPVPTAYLEIGFFDNAEDLEILQSQSDVIGKAIAEGINEYLQSVEPSVNTGSTSESGSSSTTASKGEITITSNEKKFLGLWKNKTGIYERYYNEDGTINENALYDPDGKLVDYVGFGSPVYNILHGTEWLFDLLRSD